MVLIESECRLCEEASLGEDGTGLVLCLGIILCVGDGDRNVAGLGSDRYEELSGDVSQKLAARAERDGFFCRIGRRCRYGKGETGAVYVEFAAEFFPADVTAMFFTPKLPYEPLVSLILR